MVHWKMVEMVNFMSGMFHHSKKTGKINPWLFLHVKIIVVIIIWILNEGKIILTIFISLFKMKLYFNQVFMFFFFRFFKHLITNIH